MPLDVLGSTRITMLVLTRYYYEINLIEPSYLARQSKMTRKAFEALT
jgi:hypothetical protein